MVVVVVRLHEAAGAVVCCCVWRMLTNVRSELKLSRGEEMCFEGVIVSKEVCGGIAVSRGNSGILMVVVSCRRERGRRLISWGRGVMWVYCFGSK